MSMNTQPDDVIVAIGQLPADLRRGKASMFQLLSESGYPDCPDAVTVQKLRDHFTRHPGDLDGWVLESCDTRSSPSWYIQAPDAPGTDGKWVVGFYPGSTRQAFEDGAEACAIFVKHWLDAMGTDARHAR